MRDLLKEPGLVALNRSLIRRPVGLAGASRPPPGTLPLISLEAGWSAPWLQARADRSPPPSPSSTPPQHVREGDVGEGAEEGVGFELAAGQAGEGRPVRKWARPRGGARSGISRRRAVARRRLASSRWT